MLPEEFVKAEAVRTAWLDAGYISVNAVLGVLFVFRNRVNAGWGEWLTVMLAGLTGPRQGSAPDPRQPRVRQVLERIDTLYDGTLEDKMTAGALYYSDLTRLDFAREGWFDNEIVKQPEKHPRVAQIGALSLFK